MVEQLIIQFCKDRKLPVIDCIVVQCIQELATSKVIHCLPYNGRPTPHLPRNRGRKEMDREYHYLKCAVTGYSSCVIDYKQCVISLAMYIVVTALHGCCNYYVRCTLISIFYGFTYLQTTNTCLLLSNI